MSPTVPPAIRFAWWNVNNFAHYTIDRAGEARWPLDPAEYAAKCNRIDAALGHLRATNEPDILGLGAEGRPEAFRWANGSASGLSDHLPLTGRIIFPTN